jgi:hypothetical protein
MMVARLTHKHASRDLCYPRAVPHGVAEALLMLSGFKHKMLRGARRARNDGNRDRASWDPDDQRRAYRITGAAERAP